MPHTFQITKEFEYTASPDQIWDAVATGPGIDAWFMGHSEVEPKDGGAVRFTFGDFTTVGTITVWQPRARFAYGGDEMSFDYVIEKTAGGGTLLRLTQSGMLGDNWETEYEALEKGWNLYLHTIDEYTTHFPGRT
ncbi:MAG TPA: SRPBCC domain-containing protein, partial [Pseudonocardiaceae bacterium]|nr:SRPBCC domain-containing protein [Pseudonocardiaceae bacterium]